MSGIERCDSITQALLARQNASQACMCGFTRRTSMRWIIYSSVVPKLSGTYWSEATYRDALKKSRIHQIWLLDDSQTQRILRFVSDSC